MRSMKQQDIKQPITSKQLKIVSLLYEFRFIDTTTIQHLLNHKNPTRIQQWLKDLVEEGYIIQYYDRTSFVERTKPAVYCLSTKARKLLQGKKYIEPYLLNQIYREKERSPEFRNHCCYVAQIYAQLKEIYNDDEGKGYISLFTRARLLPYKHFPQPLPDAYFTVDEKDEKTRYFLEVFDLNIPKRALKERIRRYIQCHEGDWKEETDNTDFPTILFITRNKFKQRSMYRLIQKVRDDEEYSDLLFYLTNKDDIKEEGMEKIKWQKVEKED